MKKTYIRFNSQQSSSIASLFEHYRIEIWKLAGMRSSSCRDSTSFLGVISFWMEHTVSTEFPAIRPKNLRKLSANKKVYNPGYMTKKPGFHAVNAWKPLSILERIWCQVNHHFIIEKNKKLHTKLRKPNYESSLALNIL